MPSPSASPTPASQFALNRRRSLQIGVATAATGLLVSGQTTNHAEAKDLPRGPTTTPFMDALVVGRRKDPVGSLNPASSATARTADGECGRNPHQRRDELPARKFYELEVKAFDHKFHNDLPWQRLWGFDSMFPGPTFIERYGEPTIVRIHNKLPTSAQHVGFGSPEISTHLHNLHCASESDGYAADFYSSTKHGPTLTGKGAYMDHHYPHCYAGYDNPKFKDSNGALRGDPCEALGTLWYHDHREDFTAANCYRGLMGFYLLFDHIDSGNELDPSSTALRLPSGDYDIPLMISDFLFDSSGNVEFDQFATKGILGNKFCINGKIQPKFSVKPRKYRFRLLDGSLSRFYELYLTDGDGKNYPFTYIANDGNLLPAPLGTSKVRLAPAERGDIVIDFANFPMNKPLYLVNRLIQEDGRGPEDAGTNVRDAKGDLRAKGTQLMRFDIDSPAQPVQNYKGVMTNDPSEVPPALRALPLMTPGEAVKTRNFRFDKENEVWTVNGKLFDYSKPTITVKKGTAEIWELEGNGNWHHPVHIHMEEFRILSRNGRPPPPHEAGRKDVVVLEPGEKVRIFIRFRDFTGKYMMHCHNLVHEDHSMMIRFDIVG